MSNPRKCRVCGAPVPPKRAEAGGEDNPHWPLCSERCHMVDLDRWLTGDYVISSPLLPGGGQLPGGGAPPPDEE